MKQQILQVILAKLSYENMLAQHRLEEAMNSNYSVEKVADEISDALKNLVTVEAALHRFNAMITPANNSSSNIQTDGATQ